MSLKIKFGDNLRKIRNSMGLSQEEFAELVKLDRKTINATENGKSFPTGENIDNICNALNFDYAQLFEFKRTNNNPNQTMLELITNYAGTLDKDELEYILSIIKAYTKLRKKNK